MKKFLEKLLDKYIEYKKRQDEEELKSNAINKSNIPNFNKYDLDDYDEWSEDEAEDLLTWGKEDLLHN